jgi:polyhydroxyalkanoate synthesis regulator phasin
MNWRQREHDQIDQAVERGELTPEEGRREHRELDREVDALYREERERSR